MSSPLMKYKKFSPALIAVSLVASMGLLLWFGILPLYDLVTKKADSIQEYYAIRDNRADQMSKLSDLQAQFETIQMEEEVLAILLSEGQVVDFVRTLERLAEETGVHVLIRSKTGSVIEEKQKSKVPVKKAGSTDDTEKEVVEKRPKTPLTILEALPFDRYLRVEVVVTGEYLTIVTFLHKMETLSLGLDVVGMTMRVRDEEASTTIPAGDPGRNPFLMLSGEENVSPEGEQFVEKNILGTLEASFDTVVYLDKQ
jgi:chaperonin cofactor prefoldin